MCENDKVQRCIETVMANLTRHGIRFGHVDTAAVLYMSIAGKNGTYACIVDATDAVVRVFSVVGCHAPEEKRGALIDMLNRINWRVAIGNFEMDATDGEIRFRTTLDTRGGELTDEMVECTIRVNLSTVDRFHSAILALLWNDLSAEDALAMAEGNSAK